MDSDQRLQALKKAYADVILNISKEAAAKVMAAERKAQGLEHEIRCTKDEAVQMMVRLKKKMDDEIIEANMTSRNQQEKIDELEAQLQEAEDIVTGLREQLKHEQARFYRVTRSDMHHLDKHDNAIPEEAFEENRQSQSIPCPILELQKDSLVASDKENPHLNRRTEYPKCSSEYQMRNLYGTMPELPSIILRSKKHKIYRNACTQRIHACERDILDNELPLSRQPDDASGKGKVEGAKKDISTCKVTLNEVNKMFNIESKEAVGKNGSISCWYEVQPKLIPREVKTDTMYRKNKTTETNVIVKEGDTEKLIAKGEPPLKTVTKYRKNDSTLGKMIPDKMFRKRHETCGVPRTAPSPKSVKDNLQPNENPPATKPKLSNGETNNNDKQGDIKKLISNGEPPVDILVPLVQEGTSAESADIHGSKSNLKKVDVPILQSKLKTTDATSKGSSLQHFKYTFQRKRKRETMSICNVDILADKHTPERRKETQNTSKELEK